MHNAPPVAYPVGRFVWGRALWLGIGLLGALGLLVCQWHGGASGLVVFAAWVFWAGCLGVGAVWSPQQNLRNGRLFWSGEDWFWLPDRSALKGEMQTVSLSVGVDLGFCLLLWVRLLEDESRKPGPVMCAWLEKQTMPSKWHGFRCAVYSWPPMSDTQPKPYQDRL